MNHLGLAGSLARSFVSSKLTPLLILAAVLLGTMATLRLPREEEPQIQVPMVDLFVAMPDATAAEIEQRVTTPLESILWEVPGIEYLYSTSMPNSALVVARFRVGTGVEESLVRLRSRLESHFDRIPPGVSFPLLKPRSIDDVPILALTLHGSGLDHADLRRVAVEVQQRIKAVPQVSQTQIIGGLQRQVRVLIDPARASARHLDPLAIAQALASANAQSRAGALTTDDREVLVATGGFFQSAADVTSAVIGVHQGKPVYLGEVAEVIDGPAEPAQYVFTGLGAAQAAMAHEQPAVTLSVAKQPGANAISVAQAVRREVEALRGTVIPAAVDLTVSRDYAATAGEKSDELLFHMGLAVLSVSLLMALMLGWREALVVLVAIPTTLALTLAVFQLLGYTLNRITLFALIFSIGILVDDAIVVVENLVRRRSAEARTPLPELAVQATAEVGNPTILATLAVIAAILPMASVGGLMGPYMRPIPVGSSAAMLWSLLVAFVVTPWASARLLGRSSHHAAHEDLATRSFRAALTALVARRWLRWSFLGLVALLLLGAVALVPLRWVQVKMLPFDNKSEFQVLINMPEGTSLERTARVARDLAAVVRTEPEVTDYQVHAGTAGPFNFNGLVRHYYLRRSAHQADLQVNLLPKHARTAQSHTIAKRVRERLAPLAQQLGAVVTVAEVPPGPPVLQTLVAEVYAPTAEGRLRLAEAVREVFRRTPGVVDVDWYVSAAQDLVRLVPDKEKARLHGIDASRIRAAVSLATTGQGVGLLHDPAEREDVGISVELPRSLRTRPEDLLDVGLLSAEGQTIPLRELVTVVADHREGDLYHKNLLPVTYVVGDVAGVVESPVYAILAMNAALQQLDPASLGGPGARLQVLNAHQPTNANAPTLKWDGEWHITIEVFRDLGLAFGVVLVLIYLLMVGWFKSFLTPLVVMGAIPFSLIGILPAHALGGVFFTATSMIGFMAGAGIVVRNSIILVDFIQARLAEGLPLAQAVVEAGAVRFRPIFLTAAAVVVGAAVILFDPIFQGLAISLMAGSVAAVVLSILAIPLLYLMVFGDRR